MAESTPRPIDNILDKAFLVARHMEHRDIKPFHLLKTIVDDTNASNFLAEQGFPINDVRTAVDTICQDLERDGSNNGFSSLFEKHAQNMSYDEFTIYICRMAQKLADKRKNPSPGYLEMLYFLNADGDEASKTAIRHFTGITFDDIIHMIGRPSNKIESPAEEPQVLSPEQLQEKRHKIIHMDEIMKKNIIGQDAAITLLHKALKRNLAGLKAPNKPQGTFLFPGPTGVGKTEVAKQLAELQGVELVRIDMSELMEKHSVSKLIGSPPGYMGCDEKSIFESTVGKHKDCVLLLDEVEKAHPEVFNILLQVMDNGEVTCSNGEKVSFRNTTIIMSSNAGAEEATAPKKTFSMIPAEDESSNETDSYKTAVNGIFRPEFRNRLDAVVPFDVLSKPDMVKIAGIMIERLNTLEAAQSYDLNFKATPETLTALVDISYDPTMGARPLERAINEQIKDVLADYILDGNLSEAEITIGHDGNEFTFHQTAKPRQRASTNDNFQESEHYTDNGAPYMNGAPAL